MSTSPPSVPEYELVRPIGDGSFGAVWLARNIIGTYRAVKVVHRRNFKDERPYEREFEGIRHFEPISRLHEGFVAILQIGRNERGNYFYYVMELADDFKRRKEIHPETYQPRTLSSELHLRGRLPLNECLEIGTKLAAALGHLHHHRLIHRDVKSSNIVFVRGRVKLADVGLVTRLAPQATVLGTEGYIPERGAGSSGADLYGLGKVLYEVFTGKDRLAFPELPTHVAETGHLQAARRFNEVLVRACDPDPRQRFHSARELFEELSQVSRLTADEARGASTKWFRALWSETGPPEPMEDPRLEAIGGAVPLDSAFYIERPADEEFREAVARHDCIVLVKGARQMGKTSLLARGLEQARQEEARIVLCDVQEFNDSDLTSLKDFYIALGEVFADALNLENSLAETWDESRSPNGNFERFMRRNVLSVVATHLFWGLDEVDRLFTTSFGDQVFAMFRAWYNKRALDPRGPWAKLTIAIAFATEAHLFITDLNQSPFNVGTQVALEDFSVDEVIELNQRYGNPIRNRNHVPRFMTLLGGQPYLTRRALHELVTRHISYDAFEPLADREDGVFGGHLRRLWLALKQDAFLMGVMAGVLKGKRCPTPESFYRLRSAGLLGGDSAHEAKPRCELYAKYLKRCLR
jgi:hypothetical protein